MDQGLPSRVRQIDIARACGVSKGTVSLALNRSPLISPETKKLVCSTAEKLGYRPEPGLRKLAAYRWQSGRVAAGSTLGLLSPKRDRGVPTLEKSAAAFGYRVERFSQSEYPNCRRLAEVLRARGVEGILVAPWNTADYFHEFPWEDFSAISLFGGTFQPPLHIVRHDAFGNALALEERLRRSSLRRVGVTALTGSGGRTACDQRMFAASHFLAHEAPDMPLFVDPADIPTHRLEMVVDWVKQKRLDGLITPGAFIGRRFLEIGYRIPDDLAVIVMNLPADNEFWSGFQRNDDKIIRRAVSWLDRMISQGETGLPELPETHVIPGSWHPGRSFLTQAGSDS